MRSLTCMTGVALAGSLLWVAIAWAGGWAVATAHPATEGAVAGEPYAIRLSVRQHGVTPIRLTTMTAEARGPGATTVTGTVRPLARTGRYVVSFTFPERGRWSWVLRKRPFADQRMGVVQVAAAGTASAATTPPEGRSLFDAKGCVVCHMGPEDANESIGIGPSLRDLRARLGPGAAAYVRQSILQPDAVDAAGGGGTFDRMPTLEVTEAEARAIVAYLLRP